MSIETTFSFDIAANFNLSNTQISGAVAKLALVPNTGQVFSQDFSSDVGFTYDNTKAEFTSGLVRQKDQRPNSAILGGKFETFDLNWITSGSLTATQIGTPTLSGGRLSCTGGGNNAVKYSNANIGSGNVGAFKLKYRPNYSGTPPVNTNIFEFKHPSNNNDRMLLFHGATGVLRFTAYTSAGTIKHSAANFGGVWSPVAGTEYEIELNWDTIAGIVRLFVDGVLQGSMPVSSYARGTDATDLHIGAGIVYTVADAQFDDIILFPAVQHTAGYTPGYTLQSTIYLASTVALPAFSYTGIGTIIAVESSTFTEVGAPRYIVAGLYWNGSDWVASNGTYSQANTSAQVVANLTALNVTGASSVSVSALFDNSNSLSSIDLVSVTVTGQKYSTTGYLEPAQALQVQDLLAYTQSATIPVNSELKIAFKIDGVLKYYNGSAWVTSDGTLAQANLAADLTSAAFDSLNLGSNSSVYIRWILGSSANTVTSEISSATITYDFGGVGTDLATCLVYGYLKDVAGNPVSNATIIIGLLKTVVTDYQEANKNLIFKPSIYVETDENGYFETNLIRSSEFGSDQPTYRLVAKGLQIDFIVPDSEQKDIADLVA